MTFIIGLTGQKRSGKDTAGKMLVSMQPGLTRLTAFADPLKEYAYDLDPLVAMERYRPVFLQEAVDSLGWEQAKDVYPQVRRTLQRLGTEVFRKHVSPDYWTNLMAKRILDATLNGRSIIVTDCRFQNEIDLIRQFDDVPDVRALTIRINRDSVAPDAASAHVSETNIAEMVVDYDVQNNGTLADLEKALGDVLHQAAVRG